VSDAAHSGTGPGLQPCPVSVLASRRDRPREHVARLSLNEPVVTAKTQCRLRFTHRVWSTHKRGFAPPNLVLTIA
jgi:hypothetical protein